MPRKAQKKSAVKAAPKKRVQRARRAPSRPNAALNSVARTVGGVVGNAILPGIGGQVGSSLADLGHQAIKAITGMGDYEVKENSLVIAQDAVPQFAGKRSTRIKHREYLGDVVSGSAAAFTSKRYNINPGDPVTFPWASSLARNFETYKVHGMVVDFKTMSADALNSTNTALGQVMIATQYNVNATPFANKQQLENYEFAVSGKPSRDIMHAVECAPAETPISELYVRSQPATSYSNQDLRLYDMGVITVATNGLQASNVNLGELWISYDIEFFKPRLGYLVGTDHWRGQTAPSLSQYFGSTRPSAPEPGSNLGTSINDLELVLPNNFVGQMMIQFMWYGQARALTVPTITYTGVSGLNILLNDSSNFISNSGATSDILFVTCSVSVNGGGKIVFTNGSGVLPLDATAMDCFVTAIPYLT